MVLQHQFHAVVEERRHTITTKACNPVIPLVAILLVLPSSSPGRVVNAIMTQATTEKMTGTFTNL